MVTLNQLIQILQDNAQALSFHGPTSARFMEFQAGLILACLIGAAWLVVVKNPSGTWTLNQGTTRRWPIIRHTALLGIIVFIGMEMYSENYYNAPVFRQENQATAERIHANCAEIIRGFQTGAFHVLDHGASQLVESQCGEDALMEGANSPLQVASGTLSAITPKDAHRQPAARKYDLPD